jgi:hypothetical protein
LLFFRIVISFDVSENPVHSNADVGEGAHHLEYLSTVDALVFVHSIRVPSARRRRKRAELAALAEDVAEPISVWREMRPPRCVEAAVREPVSPRSARTRPPTRSRVSWTT